MRLVPLLVLAVSQACTAQQLDDRGAALLFAQGHDGLSGAEQVAIYKTLGLVVDSTGKGFLDTSCSQPAGATVSFSDWNHDGKTEVLILFGNDCTSGMAGSSAVLLIRGPKGGYSTNLGFPAGAVDTLPTRNLGYPDLLIGGPGFCFPVWRWNGKEYEYLENVPQSPGGCDHLND
jgi:hypothetical protein